MSSIQQQMIRNLMVATIAIPLTMATTSPAQAISLTDNANARGRFADLFTARAERLTARAERLTARAERLTASPSNSADVPEPFTIVGSATALGLGIFLKRKQKGSHATQIETGIVG